MYFDFSILRDIDFTNKENLLFLALFLLLGIIIFFIVIFIIAKIIKAIESISRKIFVNLFHPEIRAPSFARKESFGGQKQNQPLAKIGNVPDIVKRKLPTLEPVDIEKSEKKEEENKDITKGYKEENEKNIEKGMSQLRKTASEDGQTIQSRMPSMADGGKNEDDVTNVPKPIHSLASGLQATGSQNSFGNIGHSKSPKESSGGVGNSDSSIFKGEQEVSRRELEYRMKTESSVWQAAKGEGLNMSPAERSKLVKEVFSSEFGENISRSDLKSGIRKLNQKMASAKNPEEHAKIRKEVNFLKKIGGVK